MGFKSAGQRYRRLWLASVLALGCLVGQGVVPDSASGQMSTAISVRFPEIVVLHYYPSFQTAITAKQIANKILRNSGAPTIDQQTAVVTGGLSLDAGLDPNAPAGPQSPGALRLGRGFFGDFFGVRSASPSGTTRVRVALDQPVATHSSGDRITATQVIALIDGRRGADVVINTPGLRAVFGSIRLTLDTRAARRPGTYSGIRIRITAETI